MEFKQNPFGLYDFLGYFVPGAIAIYGFIGLLASTDPTRTPAMLVAEHLSFERSELYIPFVLLAYIAGHALSFAASVAIERYSIWQFDYPSKQLLDFPSRGFFDVDEPIHTRRIVRALVSIFLLPVTVFDVVFGKYLRVRELYVRPLDPRVLIATKINRLVAEESEIKEEEFESLGSPNTHDFFRYIYHFVLERAAAHRPKMQNYVALYGFLRTLCLICVIYFWAFASLLVTGDVVRWKAWLMIGCLAVLAAVAFMAFMKFYRRFTLEVFMAFASVYSPSVDGPRTSHDAPDEMEQAAAAPDSSALQPTPTRAT